MTIIKSRIRSSAVTITTTAGAIPADPLPTRMAIMIQNVGAVTVYIGDSSVSTSTGYQLSAGETIAWDIGEGVDIYGIVASGTCELRIVEGANPNQ